MSERVCGSFRLHEGRAWHIQADPDIMIRLKRIFPRIHSTDRGALLVRATPESARDLEWVTQRWNLTASASDFRALAAAAEAHRETEQRVQQVLAGTSLTAPVGQLDAEIPLRPYQIQGRDLIRTSGAALIVDELGLGKTATALALLEDPAARPALAVTLTGLQGQWLREMRKFYPSLLGVEPKTAQPHDLSVDGRTPDLIVMNYAKLAGWQHHLQGQVRTVIFDEIQELRRNDSNRYRAASTVASTASLACGLSATPVYNYGSELFNIVNVLRPGMLGSTYEFGLEWCGTRYAANTKTRITEPAALREHLMAEGMFLRRTRADVGIDLPPIETVEQYVPSDSAVLRKLEGDAIEMARLIVEDPKRRFHAAGDFDWRMRQITGISKAPFVADFVKLLLESEDKILLFGWHRACYDIWLEKLADYKPVLYTGTESPSQKSSAVQAFTQGDSRVLIMSLRSGAGLDGLQDAASTIVFGELDWSPGVHKQAIGRLGRPGQRKRTLAYFCTTDDGADPFMIETLDIKAIQADQLIEPEHVKSVEPITRNDRIRQLAQAVLERHRAPKLGTSESELALWCEAPERDAS